MAKLKVCSIYDSKVEAFMSPFFQRTLGEAIRNWEASVNDQNSDFWKFPSDFTLFQLAEYDQSTGKFENLSTPVSLGLALSLKKEPVTQLPLFKKEA